MDERSLRIKKLFEESGMTYQELEKRTGVKKSSLQRYASGSTSKIPLPAIEKIAAAFNVDPQYILGWTEDTYNALYEAAIDMQKNDALSDIVARLRTDDDFFCIVQALYEKTPEQISALASLFK